MPEPELNLSIGSFRISSKDLTDGTRIRKGDEIVCHWRMDDNGLLSCALEIPSVGQTFDTGRFYADTAGHRNFAGDEGHALAQALVEEAAVDLRSVDDALGEVGHAERARLRTRLDDLRASLTDSDDADHRRSVSEAAREIRQDVSRLRHKPEHRAAILTERLTESRAAARRELAPHAESGLLGRIGAIHDEAEAQIALHDAASFQEAERLLDQADTLRFRELWQQPDFVAAMFAHASQRRYVAVDKGLFDRLVGEGTRQGKSRDTDGLRRTVIALWENEMQTGGTDRPPAALATLMRR